MTATARSARTVGSLVQPYGYTGREYDPESGLYHYRARAYDPAAGVFLQEDPIGFSSMSQNLYGYVRQNAFNRSDPTGFSETLSGGGLTARQIGMTLGVTGAVSAAVLLGPTVDILAKLDWLGDTLGPVYVESRGEPNTEERKEYCIGLLEAKQAAIALMRRACYANAKGKRGQQQCYRQAGYAEERAWKEYYACLDEE